MKHDDAPYRRWNPQPAFLAVIHHPATPGKQYTVRHGQGGEPFQAWYSYGNVWHEILPDANGDGTNELGPKIGITLDLQWLSMTP